MTSSDHELQIPITGRPARALREMPSAWIEVRWMKPARSAPPNQRLLRRPSFAHRFSSRIGSRVSDESAYCGGNTTMSVTEIAPRTWRIESLIGPRNLFQYLIAGEEAALIVDTGTSATPRDEILPALRHVDVPAEAVRFIVVTHPDLDHQGGLAGSGRAPSRTDRLRFRRSGPRIRAETTDQRPIRRVRGRVRPQLHGGREGMDSRVLRLRMLDRRHLRGRRGDRARRPAPGCPARTGSFGRTSRGARVGERPHVHIRRGALALVPGGGRQPCAPADLRGRRSLSRDHRPDRVARAEELHSGHWPARSGAGVTSFLTESREFV